MLIKDGRRVPQSGKVREEKRDDGVRCRETLQGSTSKGEPGADECQDIGVVKHRSEMNFLTSERI
jgi:hypothetical protein